MGSTATSASIVVAVLAIIAVALRFFARRLTKVDIGADDWWILAGLLLTVGVFSLLVYGDNSDPENVDLINRDSPTFDYTPHVTYLKMAFVTATLYFSVMTAIKVSILIMYRRIFFERLIYEYRFFMSVVILWWVAGTITAIVSCIPINRLWVGPSVGGYCFNFNIFWLAVGAVEVVIDAGILALPVSAITHLRMSNHQKILVSGTFLMGGFVVITGIVRVILGYRLGSQNVDFKRAELWSAVHVCMAIVCSCLPSFRPLYTRMTATVRRIYAYTIHSSKSQSSNPSDKSHNATARTTELITFGRMKRARKDGVEDTNVDTTRLTAYESGELGSCQSVDIVITGSKDDDTERFGAQV